ncbi:MAG TPA: DNA primase [Flavobacterium sp.]|nr:DNA primase [Flavobacterium sp.]
MKRIIVDYSKLTNEILTLLVEKFPDGYDDSNIIRFRNAKNELIEAVEVRTEDTIYLVKVSTKLASRIENFDEDDDFDVAVPIDAIKDLDLDDEADDEDEENEEKIELDDDSDDDTDEDRDIDDIGDDEDDEDDED